MIDGASLQDGVKSRARNSTTACPGWTRRPPPPPPRPASIPRPTSGCSARAPATSFRSTPPPSLSGILNAASSAAQAFGEKVHVLDSGQVSLGLGFQVLAAAEAIYQGASLENVLRLIKDVRKRVRLVAMLDTLEYVRRSGRVSWARARLGNLLQIKPFIELREGTVFSLGETRTRTKGMPAPERIPLQAGQPGAAGDLAYQCRARCPPVPGRAAAQPAPPAAGDQRDHRHRQPRRTQRLGFAAVDLSTNATGRIKD